MAPIGIGNGRSSDYYFFGGRKANLHGTLYVGARSVWLSSKEKLAEWYGRWQFSIWFWMVFTTWMVLGLMVALMAYAVMRG